MPPTPDILRYGPDQVPEGERRKLLDRVPKAAHVLDVGCWSGFNGRYLIASRSAVMDGVEPVAEMAQVAARDYRTVHVTSVEDALVGALGKARGCYDVVLLLDVLEHLVDPTAVLQRLRHVLRPGGRALVSLPNVAHWSVRKDLALGRFTYTPYGLLDVTHLRFFTVTSGEALVVEAGWIITWRSASVGSLPLIALSDRLLSGLARWPGLFAVQMLFEIRPAD